MNINTAGADELKALPGIGPAKAEAIVEYRKQHGNFKSVEELKNVKGIGDGIYNRLKDEGNGIGRACEEGAAGGEEDRLPLGRRPWACVC